MFTGIIQGIAEIKFIEIKKFFSTYIIKLPKKMLIGLELGSSLSNNGCCLTVSKIQQNLISIDVTKITLKITNLGTLKVGDKINIERPLTLTDEIGGHLMSGHIMTTAKIYKILNFNTTCEMCFAFNKSSFMKFIFNKGFIGIDGISLTISKIYKNKFFVNLIPQTLLSTTIGLKKIGELVNVEIDFKTQIIVECIERLFNKNIILNK